MEEKNSSALFYTCSLIEYIGRTRKLERIAVVDYLGGDAVERIYDYADVFHCEMIEKVAAEFIVEYQIPEGSFDNIAECRYRVPDYWDIGAVYARLVEDCFAEAEWVQGLITIYHSWIDEAISDYNTDFYYQSRGYLAACYRAGMVLE